MKLDQLRTNAPVFSLWLVLGGIIVVSHLKLVNFTHAPSAKDRIEHIFIPDPEVLKSMAMGYDQLLADCWWLSFIQYFGDSEARKKDHGPYAYAYLDLITRLDPRFMQPYWFAAFAIGAEQKRPELAEKVIKRGLQYNQDNWYLPFIAGINRYLFAHDDVGAAKYYRQASKYPGAPEWLRGQAKILEAGIPSLIKEINTWTLICRSAKEKLVKEMAHHKLIALWTRVFREAPSEPARKRAKAELKLLGVKIEE